MSVRIEIHQARSVEEGPVYRVVTTVIYASGISDKIFVFDTVTQEFSRVATPWDMENVVDTRTAAQAAADPYYRGSGVQVDYASESIAVEAAVYTRGRVASLASQYAILQDSFEGSGDYAYTGE